MKQPAADILPEDAARRIIHANQQDGVSPLSDGTTGGCGGPAADTASGRNAEVAAEVTERLNQSWLKVTRHAVGDVLAQLRAQPFCPIAQMRRHGATRPSIGARATCCRHATAFSTWRVLRTARRRISYPRRRGCFAQARSISRSRSTHRSRRDGYNSRKRFGPTIPSLSAACKRFSGICFPVTRRNRRFSF